MEWLIQIKIHSLIGGYLDIIMPASYIKYQSLANVKNTSGPFNKGLMSFVHEAVDLKKKYLIFIVLSGSTISMN